MALEDILEALEAEEKKQSEDIIARAQIQAAKLIAEAKEDAEEIMAASAKAAMENLRSPFNLFNVRAISLMIEG